MLTSRLIRLVCRAGIAGGITSMSMNLKASAARLPYGVTIRRLALLSLLGIVLYVVLDILLFFLRPDLPILRHAESDYGNGPWAWIMDFNFLLRCFLSLAAAGALWYTLPRTANSQIALGLLVVWAIASGLLAFFPDDYEGTPATAHGRIHLAAAAIAFLGCLLATLLLTRELARHWGWRPIAATLGVFWVIAALGLVLLTLVGFRPGRLDGLYERIFLGFELLWLTVAMSYLYRLNAAPADDGHGVSQV